MEQRKKVTLKDIAARTGLSVNTVSRVLNKKPYYTKEVEERVNAACKELGYIVDMNASGLRSGSTRTVAILYDDLVNPFYSYTTDIISKRLEEHGYNSIMFSNNNRSPYADYELMRAVYSRKPDGVLSVLEPTEDLVPFIQNSGIPFVIFGRDGAPYGMLGINADEVRGGAVAGKHLLDCGCRRPVYAGSWHDVKVCLDRQKGFAEALAEGGVELSPEQIIYAREVPFETLIDRIISLQADGVFCFNDMIAFLVVAELDARGIRVGKDVAVVGYDNVQQMLNMPRFLTSVDVGVTDFAVCGAEAMLDILENREASPRVPFIESHPAPVIVQGKTSVPRT